MLKKFYRATDVYADVGRDVAAPYIRRSFDIGFAPLEARVRIAASGFYELYVNGKRITKGHLAPYVSNPEHFICYDEYEIAGLLREGKNAIGVMLGNGFANQMTPQWDFDKAPFRAPLSFALELDVIGEGEVFTLSADESWRCAPSPLLFDMYRFGTVYDARLEIPGWCECDFDDSEWGTVSEAVPPRGEIVASKHEPIVTVEQIKPISHRHVGNFCYLKTAYRGGEDVEFTRVEGGYLFDFGKSYAGVCRLKIRGERGRRITLRHGERLDDDGNFTLNSIYTYNKDNLHLIDKYQTDVYILSGNGEEIYTPPFTYHGFRYVLVEGIEEEDLTEDTLTLTVMASDVRRRSNFATDSDIIDKLYGMAIHADLSNFHYFPTDCPHREKNGWTGDISVSAEQLLLSFDCKESLKTWLRSLRHAQLDCGMLPGIVPTSGWGYEWGNGPFWDAAAINLPYYIYKYDSDLEALRENADMIARYLKYVASRRDERGLVGIGLGDWVQPGAYRFGILSPLCLTDSVTVYDMAAKASEIFLLLGRKDECEMARRLAGEMRAAVREHLIDYETMSAAGNCQTSQALLIRFGFFTPEEYPRAYARLIEIIKRDGGKLILGVIGLRYIFDVLIDGGDAELAFDMICSPEPPSYAALIERGASAMCECLEENGVQESENHHFLGDLIRVFISRIAGLCPNPDFDGGYDVLFSPTPLKRLDRAEAEYDTKRGKIKCGWEKRDGKTVAYIEMPSGTSGVFSHGGITVPLGVGRSEFEIL